MSKRHDRTSIGEIEQAFRTTCWTDIRRSSSHEIIERLVKRYWKPVYCYLRRKGYANEPAKDLTQGFFQEIVLGKSLVQQADQTKGRFRTFLLTALDRYVSNVCRKEAAQKRAPMEKLLQLDDENLTNTLAVRPEAGPDQMFHYAWASELIDAVLKKVREDCYTNGRETHWEVFNLRVLSPIIDDAEVISLTEVCKRHRIDSEQKASNMIITVKRTFRSILEQQLRQLVSSDSEVHDEFNELLKALSAGGAR